MIGCVPVYNFFLKIGMGGRWLGGDFNVCQLIRGVVIAICPVLPPATAILRTF